MKKIRPKTASGEHMSRSSRESQLTQKVVIGIMGASFCMIPLAGVTYASDITKYNAYNTSATIAEHNGVFSIMADYRSGDNAVNQFSKFSLDQYHIANLYFKKAGDTGEAKRLFNFVDGRIDVNGTINAIRSGKVGGDLYFLSKDGMVVGADGVINAGSINIMTPTESAYNSMRFHGEEDEDDHASMEGKIGDRADKIISKHFAINPDGTIEISRIRWDRSPLRVRTSRSVVRLRLIRSMPRQSQRIYTRARTIHRRFLRGAMQSIRMRGGRIARISSRI